MIYAVFMAVVRRLPVQLFVKQISVSTLNLSAMKAYIKKDMINYWKNPIHRLEYEYVQ